jgi:hypothetical protein
MLVINIRQAGTSELEVVAQKQRIKLSCTTIAQAQVLLLWRMWQNGREVNCMFHNAKRTQQQMMLVFWLRCREWQKFRNEKI